MINESEISNLIYLLDDTDIEVIEQVEQKILSLGIEAITFLEHATFEESEALRLERLQYLIRKLKRSTLINDLTNWKHSDEQDLLEGMLLVERIEFPHTDVKAIQNKIDKIKLDAWLELNDDLTSYEQIKILNYIFFQVHKFLGNTENYHHSHNSFISKVLENKQGNPISMAIVYSLVAQRLNIPVFGVNLPQHFVLGYQNAEGMEIIRMFNDPANVGKPEEGDIMFYINPFSEGLILNHDSLRSFLTQLNIKHRPEYFKVCSNVAIIQRVLRNLLFSYEKEEQTEKAEMVRRLMDIL